MENESSLETERLILQIPRASDIPVIVKLADNLKVAGMTLNIPFPYKEKDAIQWINEANRGRKEGSHYIFGIYRKSPEAFMGGIGLRVNKRFNRANLGYWVGEPFWNEGFATEAAGTIMAFGFKNLELNKIFASHLPNNPASARVMIKNGMIKEGERREHVRRAGEYLDLIQYGITRSAFDS